MAKAKKLPSGRWRVQVFAGKNSEGKNTYRSFTATTKKEAEFLASQFAAMNKEAVSEITVGKAIDKYIDSKSNVLSPTTLQGYRSIRTHQLKGIIDIPLRKLTQQAVQVEINGIAAVKSAKTVSNIYGLLSAALNVYAPDLRLKVTLPAKKNNIKELPSPADVLSVVIGSSIELPCLLAMWLGMRMSEILGLRKSNIIDGSIIIKETLVLVDRQEVKRDATKTYKSTRKIAVPEYIMNLIDQVEGDVVVTFTRDQIYTRLRRLLKNNNIQHISFHQLRHLNASVMLKLGIQDKYAMERGGWSTPSVLKSVYQHTFSDEREAADKLVNDYFSNIISHEISHEKQVI